MALANVGVVARRAVLLSAAVTLLVLAADSAATPRQSAPDQYEQQPSPSPPPPRSLHPKLNRVHLAHTGYHRFSLLPSANHKDVKVPELQVGCAEGSLHEHRVEPRHQPSIKLFKNPMKFRQKREASPQHVVWFNVARQQGAVSPTVLQSYQVRSSAPFYLPVWGNPSRIPVLFPAKPILFNPGYPTKNRPMPPVSSPNVTIDSRIRDDKPSWGVVEPITTTTSTVRPPFNGQRPTKPPTPPLFHRPSLTEDQQSNNENTIIAENIEMVFTTTTTTTTTRPPPPPPPPTPAFSGTSVAASNGNGRELNRCVWAIISCCNPTSPQVKGSCFEQLGCPGAFWDRSPCSREVTVAALNAAQRFYDQS